MQVVRVVNSSPGVSLFTDKSSSSTPGVSESLVTDKSSTSKVKATLDKDSIGLYVESAKTASQMACD